MTIYLGTDHTGLDLKNRVKAFLEEKNYTVVDCGAYTYDKDDDYPDFIGKAAEAVSKNPEESRGIVFGGSGQGEAIVANKYPNVRCALFYTPALPTQSVNIEGEKSEDPFEMLKLTRAHNDANVLSIGFRFVTEEDVLTAVQIWLDAAGPTAERHKRRINKIATIEKDF